jgi:hypothetical protein
MRRKDAAGAHQDNAAPMPIFPLKNWIHRAVSSAKPAVRSHLQAPTSDLFAHSKIVVNYVIQPFS